MIDWPTLLAALSSINWKGMSKTAALGTAKGLAKGLVGATTELAEDLPQAVEMTLDKIINGAAKAGSVAGIGEELLGGIIIAPFLVFNAMGEIMLEKAKAYQKERLNAPASAPPLPPEFETSLQQTLPPPLQEIVRKNLPLYESLQAILEKSPYASEKGFAASIDAYRTAYRTDPSSAPQPDVKAFERYVLKYLARAKGSADPALSLFFNDYLRARGAIDSTGAELWSDEDKTKFTDVLDQQNEDFNFPKTLPNGDEITASYGPSDPTDPTSSKEFKLQKKTKDSSGTEITYSVALNDEARKLTTTDKDGNVRVVDFSDPANLKIIDPGSTTPRAADPDEGTEYMQQANLMNERLIWIKSHEKSERATKSLSNDLITGLSASFKSLGFER